MYICKKPISVIMDKENEEIYEDDFELVLRKAFETKEKDEVASGQEAPPTQVSNVHAKVENGGKNVSHSSPKKRKKMVDEKVDEASGDSPFLSHRFYIAENDFYLLRLLSILSGNSMSWHIRKCLSPYLSDFREFLSKVKDKDFLSVVESFNNDFNS